MRNIFKILTPFVGRKEKIRYLINLQSWAATNKKYILMKVINTLIYRKFHCDISPFSKFGSNVNFPHPVGIVIGEGVWIGNNVTIYQNVTLGRANGSVELYPTVQDNVVLYANSMVLGDCTVKSGSTVGAYSLVMSDTRENSVWVGIPAKCVKPSKKKIEKA
ncbi:serine O-acetyltransferase [Fictibacillus fluitans]|uniref:Serine acetyltransferase n=1 Tax=Fictibacillus fluitans TaxID=3058422 RepID=A0ABT8HT45_9BACL|nr:hypothetical protein [Fictibacillus sp. NE201]MDN4523950.1 hypothetical protein [Fictibacillus sp. NE201]